MIDAIATRWTNFQGKLYAKGDPVKMPLQQFQDLEPTGIFERAPTKSAAKRIKASGAGKAAADQAETTPPSSEPAD